MLNNFFVAFLSNHKQSISRAFFNLNILFIVNQGTGEEKEKCASSTVHMNN